MKNSFEAKRKRRVIKFFILYIILRGAMAFLMIFTREALLRFSDLVGSFVFTFDTKGKRMALKNLKKAYKNELPDEKIHSIAQQVFTNLIKVFIDLIYTRNIATKDEYLKYVEIVGEENLKKAYDKGKGVICLIPHLSSWEFSAITPPLLGYETSAASKKIRSPHLNNLMVGLREKRGMKNISRDNSYEKLIETLNNGECLIIMIDQDTRVKGVFVDFFGEQAYTPMGVARLAKDSGAAVVPMAMSRKEDNNYRFTILPEEPLIETGDEGKDILLNTQRHTTLMEEFIREHPEQWVWIHDRWRTTPEGIAYHLKIRERQKKEEEERRRKKGFFYKE